MSGPITNQPMPSGQIMNEADRGQPWSEPQLGSGMFKNIGTTICALAFPLCLAGNLATRLGESYWAGFCLGPGGVLAMRAKLRAKHSLEGAICSDVLPFGCPLGYQLALCQTAHELDHQGYR